MDAEPETRRELDPPVHERRALAAAAASTPDVSLRSRTLLIVAATLAGLGSLGAALAPYLAVQQPLLLLALSPWPRHMLLVAPHTTLPAFMAVASLRAFIGSAIWFEVGKLYGARGLARLDAQSVGLARFVRRLERGFGRAAVLLLVVLPGPLTAALGGMGGQPRTRTLALLLPSHALWAYLSYRLGDWLAPWTLPLMAFLRQRLLLTTLLCASVVLAYQWLARRQRLRKLTR